MDVEWLKFGLELAALVLTAFILPRVNKTGHAISALNTDIVQIQIDLAKLKTSHADHMDSDKTSFSRLDQGMRDLDQAIRRNHPTLQGDPR